MELYSLGVASEEQALNLSNDVSVSIKFDPYYYRWYANYYRNGELIAAGIALDPNTFGLHDIQDVYCGILDTGDPKVEYEPFEELGNRLAVIEVDNE